MSDNPLLNISFEIPFDAITAAHVEPAIDALLADAQSAIDRVCEHEGTHTYASSLGALEAATERLEIAMTTVTHLESVATNDALREAVNQVKPKASAFWSAIPMNAKLYAAINAFAQTSEAGKLNPVKARLLKKTLNDFKRHGAELDDAGKERLAAINVELTKVTTQFSQNVLDSTNAFELIVTDEAKLAGLPDSAKEAARENAKSKDKDGYRFTLQAPSLIPVLTYLEDESIRETIWRAYNTRASGSEVTGAGFDNRALTVEILKLRAEKAKLLGYDNFADLVLEDRMAKSGNAALEFVTDLRKRTIAAFEKENDELRAFKEESAGGELNPWDVGIYSEKLRKKLYDFDDEEVRPYFPVDHTMKGMFTLAQQLYGVTIRETEMPGWDDAVRTFAIEDDGEMIAAFYVDLYPRENKRGGAWMNALIYGADKGAPHLGLFCANMNPPVAGKPALLRHREVETLFHEFGHLLHHALSEVPLRSLGGTNVAWDFVELPSQIMENFCWERVSLDLIAAHHETGEKIPDALFEKMQRARSYRAANAQMRQLGFGAVDLGLHCAFDPNGGTEALMSYARETLAAHAATELPEDYAMIMGFGHLFSSPVGYAAGYYSYKWAEVLDADAFTKFKENGVIDKATGQQFRATILAKGDSEDPAELYRMFMGREPKLDALMERNGLA